MRTAVALLLLSFAPAAAGCGRNVDDSVHAGGIQRIVASTPQWVDRTPLGERLWAAERTFYEARAFVPAWVDGVELTERIDDLLEQLRMADTHGLDPSGYGVAEFERIRAEAESWLGARVDRERVPELDARLTYAYLRHAADLLGWNADPAKISRLWAARPPREDLAARLASAIDRAAVGASLAELAPEHPQYRGLQAALVRERQQPTGNEQRIRMNLERWRWTPRDLGDRYVLVNVPGYLLQVMEDDMPALAMRVIVGQPDWPTPLFSDRMTYVVFSPYWNIPENILREETLPRVTRDPDYLERNDIEVVGTSGVVDPSGIDWSDESITSALRFRQRPGPDNALGQVKFIFPNHFSVYLHDTPSDRLFHRESRALSHGCIRVEQPVALAEYVLRGRAGWDAARITSAMQAEAERTVKLADPLPVHIGYWTAWVQPDGSVAFTDDPYGIDRAHARAMEEHAAS